MFISFEFKIMIMIMMIIIVIHNKRNITNNGIEYITNSIFYNTGRKYKNEFINSYVDITYNPLCQELLI